MNTNIRFLSIPIIIGMLLIFVFWRNARKEKYTDHEPTNQYAVKTTMENQEFIIQQENLLPVKRTFTNDSILLLFKDNESRFQLNLNLTHTDILNLQKASYSIPESNIDKIKVDLNFFNGDRNVKRINKRIVFRKGTIEIERLTENKLEMTFKGEGSGLTERDNNFPISGKINANINFKN